MVPAAHITTVSGPATRCTAPTTCMSVGSSLPFSGAAVSGSTLANQPFFSLAGGALARCAPSAADSSPSATLASACKGIAPRFVAS